MTKKTHPAESTRKLVGAAAGLALVGMVTGFQLSAQAQEQKSSESVGSLPVQKVETDLQTNSTLNTTVENQPVSEPLEQLPSIANNPEQVLPTQPAAPVPEPALVAPVPEIPNSYAPVNGTTSGSGG